MWRTDRGLLRRIVLREALAARDWLRPPAPSYRGYAAQLRSINLPRISVDRSWALRSSSLRARRPLARASPSRLGRPAVPPSRGSPSPYAAPPRTPPRVPLAPRRASPTPPFPRGPPCSAYRRPPGADRDAPPPPPARAPAPRKPPRRA